MDNIALLILGIFISVIGIVNMTGNISTIHSYNRRKVKEEDVPKYGRAVGTGTLIISVKEKQPSPAAPMMQITQKVFIVKHGISDINVTKKSNLNRFDA